jgi:uncharacterized RDD family membrane protein YckC
VLFWYSLRLESVTEWLGVQASAGGPEGLGYLGLALYGVMLLAMAQILLIAGYLIYYDCASQSATPGKRGNKLVVFSPSFYPSDRPMRIIRTVCKLLLFTHPVLIALNFLCFVATRKNQAIHDLLTDCVVIDQSELDRFKLETFEQEGRPGVTRYAYGRIELPYTEVQATRRRDIPAEAVMGSVDVRHSLLHRFWATVIDLLPLCVLLGILAAAFDHFAVSGSWWFKNEKWIMAAVACGLFGYAALLARCEGSSGMATPGKRMFRLRVSGAKGRSLTFGRALLRNLLKLYAAPLLILTAGWIYFQTGPAYRTYGPRTMPDEFIWQFFRFYVMAGVCLAPVPLAASVFFTPRRRTVYDYLSGARVERDIGALWAVPDAARRRSAPDGSTGTCRRCGGPAPEGTTLCPDCLRSIHRV